MSTWQSDSTGIVAAQRRMPEEVCHIAGPVSHPVMAGSNWPSSGPGQGRRIATSQRCYSTRTMAIRRLAGGITAPPSPRSSSSWLPVCPPSKLK